MHAKKGKSENSSHIAIYLQTYLKWHHISRSRKKYYPIYNNDPCPLINLRAFLLDVYQNCDIRRLFPCKKHKKTKIYIGLYQINKFKAWETFS